MTHIAPARIVAAARADLGERSPQDTCLKLGMNKWPQDAGLPGIGTNSTTEARVRAKAGHNGWSYHEGTHGVRPGDFMDWADMFHVSLVESVEGTGIRCIGAGGPTGKVWWQPQSEGYNPPSVFVGYFRAPDDDGRPHAPAKPKTQPVKTHPKPGGRSYTVQPDDTLWAIARKHRTTQNAILRRNPQIKHPDHIEAGWVLTMP